LSDDKKDGQKSFTNVEKKYAVLIGINNYEDSTIRDLNYSVSDIKSFYSVLIDENRGKFDVDKVKLLIQDEVEGATEPNRSNIMSQLNHLSRVATKTDSILIYFSGHGFEDSGRSYLVPSDASIDVLSETAISIDWINDNIIEVSEARVKVLIFDCCHAGARIDKASVGPMKDVFYSTIFKEAEGKAVLSSSKVNESSHEWPEKNHSVFTYFLVEGIKGEADYDKDGMVSVTDVNRYVSEKVREWAFKNSLQQTPVLQYWVSGEILLSYVPAEDIKKDEIITGVQDEVFKHVKSISLVHYNGNIVNELSAALLEWFSPYDITTEYGASREFPHGIAQHTTVVVNGGSISATLLKMNFEGKKEKNLLDILDSLSKEFGWNRITYQLTNEINFGKLVKIFREKDVEITSYIPMPSTPYIVKAGSITGVSEAWGAGYHNARILLENRKDCSLLQIDYLGGVEFERDFFEKFNPETISFLFEALE